MTPTTRPALAAAVLVTLAATAGCSSGSGLPDGWSTTDVGDGVSLALPEGFEAADSSADPWEYTALHGDQGALVVDLDPQGGDSSAQFLIDVKMGSVFLDATDLDLSGNTEVEVAGAQEAVMTEFTATLTDGTEAHGAWLAAMSGDSDLDGETDHAVVVEVLDEGMTYDDLDRIRASLQLDDGGWL